MRRRRGGVFHGNADMAARAAPDGWNMVEVLVCRGGEFDFISSVPAACWGSSRTIARRLRTKSGILRETLSAPPALSDRQNNQESSPRRSPSTAEAGRK